MRVSLCMIVRDEARCLRRCLDSLASLVDEIVIVDTGSVDETQAIARAYTSRVSELTWSGDFSLARNQSLAMATGDLLLVADADEYLNQRKSDVFREQLARIDGPETCGQILICSTFERPGNKSGTVDQSRAWIPRVFWPNVRFDGAIHEQPVGPRRSIRLDVEFEHDGYTRSSIDKKGDRNERILLRCLESQPEDSYLLYQSGQEYLVRNLADAAAKQLTKAYRFVPADAPYRLSLVVALSQSLNGLGRYAEAAELLASEVANYPGSADLVFAIGITMINWAPDRPSDALTTLIPLAIDSFGRCLEIGKQSPGETIVSGTDSWLAAHNLAILYREAMGDPVAANFFSELESSLKS